MYQNTIMHDWNIAQQVDVFQANHKGCTLNKQGVEGRNFIEMLMERGINPCHQCNANRQVCQSDIKFRG